MNASRQFCAALLFAALPLTPLAAQSLDAEVDAAYAAWNAAFDAGDSKALAAFYTDDAIFLPASHDVIVGPEEVAAFFDKLFEMGVTAHTLDVIKAEGDGKIIAVGARWTAEGKDASGSDQPWGGLATHVFERQDDGSLKLKLHSFN